MRVNPGLLEKQQRRQQQSYVNTSENKSQITERRTEWGLQFLDDRRAENIPSRLIFKYVYFDTMTNVTMKKKREQRIGMLFFQYGEKIPKSIGRRIHVKGLVALVFTSEASKTKYKINEDEDGELSDLRAIQTQSGEIIVPLKIPYKSTIHLLRGSSTRSLLYCRSWTGSKRKRT